MLQNADDQTETLGRRKIIRNILVFSLPIFAMIIVVAAAILTISESAEMDERQLEEW